MYRVLLAADGNTPRVNEQTKAIARIPRAADEVTVYLLHVFDESAVDQDSEMNDPRRVRAVTEAEDYLTDRDIDVEVLGYVGRTVPTILDVADEYEVDTIYVGGASRSPTGKAIFGSVTQDVILDSNVPVTVVMEE